MMNKAKIWLMWDPGCDRNKIRYSYSCLHLFMSVRRQIRRDREHGLMPCAFHNELKTESVRVLSITSDVFVHVLIAFPGNQSLQAFF